MIAHLFEVLLMAVIVGSMIRSATVAAKPVPVRVGKNRDAKYRRTSSNL